MVGAATSQGQAEGIAGSDSDLIGLLRGQTAFSLDSYGSLDQVLEEIEREVGEKLSRFANFEVETKLEDVKVFSVEDFVDPENMDDSNVLPVQLYDIEENPVCALVVPVSLFFILMETAFGGDVEDTITNGGMQISEAETAVFYVFCQNIADALHSGISAYSELNELVSGEAGNIEEVANWIEVSELITIKLSVQLGSFVESILLFIPIEMLEPMRAAPQSDEPEQEDVLDLDWVQDLNKAIDRTRVELRMVLAQSELSLGEIGRLVPGQNLDVGLSMRNVPVSDFEGNLLFCADLERLEGKSQFRVTGSIRKLKG